MYSRKRKQIQKAEEGARVYDLTEKDDEEEREGNKIDNTYKKYYTCLDTWTL